MISGGTLVAIVLLLLVFLNFTLTLYVKEYMLKYAKHVSFVLMWLVILNIVLMILVDWW